ncbi:transcriptional regulator with XRE-family HTH domain [Luteibacter sp. 621]|jgi:transcriptional regulator with XRE-family HTH domain|uniref:helix-turn-helix domain-containing protein n=1 Tax=Luteibacter sp. 621 TaxID=3373916 RepID=UPI003D1D7CF6
MVRGKGCSDQDRNFSYAAGSDAATANALADRIRQLRQARGKSLQEIADALGMSKSHVHQLERGTSTNPSFSALRALSAYFGVTIGFLVGEVEGDGGGDESEEVRLLTRWFSEAPPRDRGAVMALLRYQRNAALK